MTYVFLFHRLLDTMLTGQLISCLSLFLLNRICVGLTHCKPGLRNLNHADTT